MSGFDIVTFWKKYHIIPACGQIPARLKKIDTNGLRPNMPCWKIVHFMHLKCVSAYSDYNNYKNAMNY